MIQSPDDDIDFPEPDDEPVELSLGPVILVGEHYVYSFGWDG